MNYQDQVIIRIVIDAYINGLLQHEPMTVCGLTVGMEMKSRFNTLSFTYAGRTDTMNVYDSDKQSLQEASIKHAILGVIYTA
jgi:hypothetical protein